MSDLLPLAIVLPIVVSAASVIVGRLREGVNWYLAVLGTGIQVLLAAGIAGQVYGGGRITHQLAGFPPPRGIELVADGLSAAVFALVAATAFVVLAYTRGGESHRNAFYSGYLLLAGGLAGVTLTGDLFNMYVFLEITGLAAYALVASADTGRSALAGLRYLLIGTIGASLFLLGVGYAFVATGTLNMADLSGELAAAGYASRLVLASFGLIVVGLAIKTALFPVHTWQPEAYASAPDSVSTLISALVSTVSAYAIARVLFSVYTIEFFRAIPLANDVLVYAAAVSIVAGSVLAVLQSEIKRMLAYSSVSQFGLVVAAFALMNQTAFAGGTIHLVGHAVIKGGLFAAAGVIATLTGARTVDEYADLAAEAPIASGVFAVLGFALVGVPPAVGFVGKWYIALGAVQEGVWIVAAVILLSTLLTLAYFARVIERMYFGTGHATGEAAVADGGMPTDRSKLAVAVGAAVLAVGMGLLATEFVSLLQPTIDLLFNL